MKQLVFFLTATISLWSCSDSANAVKDQSESVKMKLLKQAGFDKMDKTFTYEYTVQNDSATGFLGLVPAGNKINFTKEVLTKGKLLNVFITADGHQYNTMLVRKGNTYVTRVISIDGNVFEEHEYVQLSIPPGIPPFACENDCSESCMQNCIDYYQRSVFPRLQDSANKTCKTIYFRFMCPLGAQNCHADMLYVAKPEDCFCGIHPYDVHDIAIRKMPGVILIKDGK
ncbi:MAG TPA: hypothetical protein VK484_13510 [Ferruginibacter sp.]|nr:hypothetical protein [Ferruginibacter sp.]